MLTSAVLVVLEVPFVSISDSDMLPFPMHTKYTFGPRMAAPNVEVVIITPTLTSACDLKSSSDKEEANGYNTAPQNVDDSMQHKMNIFSLNADGTLRVFQLK